MATSHKNEQRVILDTVFKRNQDGDAPLKELDWGYIGDTAVWHGVAPLLYDAWRDIVDVPETVRTRLQATYYATATQNMHQFQAATQAVDALRTAGVAAILLKGAALADPVYGNIALRPCEDVDVLIRRPDYAVARQVLASMGFEAPTYLWPDTFYLEQHFHLPFVRAQPARVYLELHWDFTDRFMLYTPDMDAVWARADTRLQLDDEYIYLAMHVAKHGAFNAAYHAEQWPDVETFFFDPVTDNRLIWMVDLWRLLKQSSTGFDWDAVADRSRAWGATPAVVSATSLLEALSGTRAPLPAAMRNSVRVAWTERWLYRSLVRPGGASRCAGLLKMNARLQFRPIRFLDVARYLFPPPDYLARRYGCSGGLSRIAARCYHFGHCLVRHAVRPLLLLIAVAVRGAFGRGRRDTAAEYEERST